MLRAIPKVVDPGDVDNDGLIALADAILALKIASRVDTDADNIEAERDVNGDSQIGTAEAINILQKM